MAIFKARNDEPNVGGIKSETDVANREVDGDAESRDLDDADMARMGKRQQTRVRCALRSAEEHPTRRVGH